MVKQFRVALALQPIATALFAASPFAEGRLNGFQIDGASDAENVYMSEGLNITNIYGGGVGANVPMESAVWLAHPYRRPKVEETTGLDWKCRPECHSEKN